MFPEPDWLTTLSNTIRSLDKTILLARACVVFGLGMAVFSLVTLYFPIGGVSAASQESLDVCMPPDDSSEQLVVAVSGAVTNPGMYTLPTDARLGAAIEAAGGFTTEADSLVVSKSLNLAQKIQDGEGIYIPFAAEQDLVALCKASITDEAEKSQASTAEVGTVVDKLVAINTASMSQLETLPGVGPKRAEAIVAGRPYQAVDDLLTKKIVTESVFNELKSLISL